jgi:predicted nucleic-acid-binding Zn-ribbon protein
MKNGTCVKCQSDEVFLVRGNKRLVIGVRRSAMLDYYVCADCGYTEIYVNADDDLDYISENFYYADGRKHKKKRKNDE